jgi:RNA polymerase sigma factor (sigma-70 family)
MATDFHEALLVNAEFLKPFAITLTHDNEDAKDLCQETLYRAYANKSKYNTGTNIRAWLYTIMRNIFINNYRRKTKQKTIFNSDASETLINNYAAHISNDALGNIARKELYSFIDKLPDIFKRPFLLYFNGYKYHEIAEALSEPLGTIKSRIHFARKMLKSEIEKK